MNNQNKQADQKSELPHYNEEPHDYSQVDSTARIAFYDDLLSAPRVTEINPAPTDEFIEALASKIYEQAQSAGGTIPYTVIREVSENFIHAQFTEVTVSILDHGNTIRFADQGPGISYKENAKLPGFTSAIEPMKHFIRGVGSGLPIVKEYLDISHGTITIEDNLGTGSVVTISLKPSTPQQAPDKASLYTNRERMPSIASNSSQQEMLPDAQGLDTYLPAGRYVSPPTTPSAPHAEDILYGVDPYGQPVQFFQGMPVQQLQQQQRPTSLYSEADYTAQQQQQRQINDYSPVSGIVSPRQPSRRQYSVTPLIPPLSQREQDFLPIFLTEGALGVTDLSRLTGVPQSSTYVTLSKLEQAGLIEKTVGQKRILTNVGYQVANSL